MSLLLAAACVLAVAALLGAVLLGYVLQGKPTPKALTFAHGPVAAIGIVLLLVAWATGPAPPMPSLALFVAAALGGAFLLYRDLAHGKVPKAVALIHGALAVTAFVILVAALG